MKPKFHHKKPLKTTPLPHEDNEYFSSISHIQNLQLLEFKVLDSFNEIINNQEKKLNNLKKFITTVKNQNSNDADLNNPISQYQLIRRMVNNWPDIVKNVDTGKEMSEKFKEISKYYDIDLPSKKDLAGSAEAIIRLQGMYRISVENFADGSLKREGSPNSTKKGSESESLMSKQDFTHKHELSTEDCLHICQIAYSNNEDYNSLIWCRHAYLKFKKGDKMTSKGTSISLIKILDHIAYALSNLYYRHFAYDIVEEIENLIDENFQIEEHPQSDFDKNRFADNKAYYLKELKSGNFIEVLTSDDWKTFKFPEPNTGLNEYYFKNYESLCRQENFYERMDQKQIDQLFCFYHTQNNNPRLILKPIKAELIQLKPSKVIFHEFLSNEEIDQIKWAARPYLQRATVHNIQTGELEHAKYRVQKSTWLREDEYRFLHKINQRITDATGIANSTAELFQVANYGIGGQYEPHYDHSRRADANEGNGARIATLLMYLTDVESGGHTGLGWVGCFFFL